MGLSRLSKAALLVLATGCGAGHEPGTPDDAGAGDGDADADGDGDADADADADGDADADADGDADRECLPDEVCPGELPRIGGACTFEGSCEYVTAECSVFYVCHGGSWYGPGPDCFGDSCQCCNDDCGTPGDVLPPRIEACLYPFAGVLGGATVELGPTDEPFRAFDEGEQIEVFPWDPPGRVWFMALRFRLRVVHDAPPDCATMTVSISAADGADSTETSSLRLLCGESREIAAIVDEGSVCATPDSTDLILTVSLEGIGEASVPLAAVTEGCP